MSRMYFTTIAPLRLETTSSSRFASAYGLSAATRCCLCPCICTRLGAGAAMGRLEDAAHNPGLRTDHWIC